MNNVDLGDHALPEWPESRGDKLEIDYQHLLLNNGWYVDLYLKVEHVLLLDDLSELEEVFMQAILKVVYEVAPAVPVVGRLVEYFELNECRLTSLYGGVVLIFRVSLLLWTVLHRCEGFYRVLLCLEERGDPAAYTWGLLLHLGKLDFILELNRVVLSRKSL